MKTIFNFPSSRCRCASVRAFLPLLLVALAAPASAQTTLAWKLKPGEALVVEMTQHTESRVGFSTKTAATKIVLQLQMSWQVLEANDESIKIKQSIEQVRATLSGTGGTAEYASASKARVTGPAKQLADSMQPLAGAQFEIDFSPQGEVKSAKPVNDAGQALLASGNKPDGSGASSIGSLTQLVSQTIVPLPEKSIAIGDQWTATRMLQSAPVPLKHETTYTLAALLDEGGGQIARIAATGRLVEEPAPSSKASSLLRVKSHEQTGSVLFSVEAGRPTLVEQSQKLQTERTFRDTIIEVTLESSLKMTFANSPAMN